MDPLKLKVLLAELCRALENEHRENLFRPGCRADCREHDQPYSTVFSLPVGVRGWFPQ
jgi:hypothetical protein